MKITGKSGVLLQALRQRGSLLEHRRLRRAGVLLALAAFCGGMVAAWTIHPDLFDHLVLRPWLLVLACVPLTILGNAAQFWMSSRLLGVVNIAFVPGAILVAILSTAANMLPLPGGTLVRIAALKRTSNTYGQATYVTMLAAGCWLGVTSTLAGCALIVLGFRGSGAATAAAGTGALVLFGVSLVRRFQATPAWLGGLLAVQVMMVAVGATRLWLCFRSFGEAVDPLAAAVLTLSTGIAALIGIAPAGLGLTEALAAGIAATISVPASLGFLAAALNRISGLVVVAPLTLLVHAVDS
ncbi:MAG TPA: hypothetical protein VE175_02430, partial [Woeseiaceae bacterium]|nr:hypothetical protein [Woeseiaceae bacterium]